MSNMIESLEDRTLLTAVTLQPPVQFAVGAGPVAIATGDLNGDGLPDLVTANTSGTISILLNTGNGTFAAAQTLTAGSRPTSVVVGDFNGGSLPDIAVANAGSGTVEVFLNQGNGSFGAPTTYNYGTAPGTSSSPEAQLVTGQFTNDGKLDLAVADDTDNKIAVLLGNGSGGFAAPIDTPFTDIKAMAAADFNGDGLTDLAVVQTDSNQVDTLLSQGDGTFASRLSETLSGQPTALVAGDFNGDNHQDLAIAITGTSGNAIDIAFGDGTGLFSSNTTIGVPTEIAALAADPINSSANPNVPGLAAVATNGAVTLYQNSGAGVFTAQTPITGLAAPTGSTIAAADFDADGITDLAIPDAVSTSAATGEVGVLFSQSLTTSSGLVASLSGSLPISAVSGSKTRLSQVLTLSNSTGKAITGRTTINLYFSTTTTVPAGASPAFTLTKSLHLLPRVSKSLALSLKPIPAVAAGSYYLVAQAITPGGVTATAASSKTVALGSPFINLAALSLNAPSSARPGGRIAVRLSLQNLGNIKLNRAVPISLGISTSSTGSSPTPLATLSPRVAAVPGQKRTGTLATRLPTTLAAGTYYLVATIDPNNTLNSPTTSNNTVISRLITIR